MKRTISIGSDPEVFLVGADGQLVPSCGLIGGTKTKTLPVEAGKAFGLGVLEDNVTLEINSDPYYGPPELYVSHMTSLMELVQKHVLDKKQLYMSVVPAARFTKQALDTPQAKVFGCDPDRDAWKRGVERVPPKPSELKDHRCAGGHLHFGYDKENCNTPDWAIVQFLDAFCLAYWQDHYRDQSVRRSFYGQPGLYRSKSYGFEYRTPNNYWLTGRAGSSEFVQDCHSVIAGVLSNEGKAQEIYDTINWERLSVALAPTAPSRIVLQYRQDMQAARDYLLNAGKAWAEIPASAKVKTNKSKKYVPMNIDFEQVILNEFNRVNGGPERVLV